VLGDDGHRTLPANRITCFTIYYANKERHTKQKNKYNITGGINQEYNGTTVMNENSFSK
jgi:hypothetical protein